MQLRKKANIGCDFSATTVYVACANNQKVLGTASINITTMLWGFESLRNIFEAYIKEHEAEIYIYIEQPWVNAARNPKTAMAMMRVATVIELAAWVSGCVPRFVHPLTWRKELYGSGQTLNSKEYAVDWTKINLGYEPPPIGKTIRSKPDHNFAEAACIAVYGSRQEEEAMNNGVSR